MTPVRPNRQQRRAALKELRQQAKVEGWGPWEPKSLVGAPAFTRAFYANNVYSVQVARQQTTAGQVDVLMIRRHDERPLHNWGDLQRIKNELLGEERWAYEVFPAAGDVVDVANMYHLWAPVDAMQPPPFGFHLDFEKARRLT